MIQRRHLILIWLGIGVAIALPFVRYSHQPPVESLTQRAERECSQKADMYVKIYGHDRVSWPGGWDGTYEQCVLRRTR